MSCSSLSTNTLLTYQQYKDSRKTIRQHMIAQRKMRAVPLTNNIRLLFENHETVAYQAQEILYALGEHSDEQARQELAVYKHLLPTHNTLSATLMLEFETDAEQALKTYQHIESLVYLQVEGFSPIWPVCNEDLDSPSTLLPVHYLRYTFSDEMKSAMQSGSTLFVGSKHLACPIPPKALNDLTQQALRQDFL